MSNKKKVGFSIIIPNYNGSELLRKNLPQVIKAYKNKINKINEIIVVDDFSQDESVKILKKEFPEVKLIKHKINRGFSAAVNTGARTAKSELIVLLNTDVNPKENFLKTVLPHFKIKEVFAVTLHEKGYGWAKGSFNKGFINHSSGSEVNEPHLSLWASGGSAVFRRSYWMDLKGMDEELFSPFYWEDVDLSYRAYKRGWLVYWDPDAHVIHKHESTIKKINKKYRQRIQERNQLLFIWKNITSSRFIQKHHLYLFRKIIRNPGYLIIFLMALRKLPIVLRKRRIEKKESKVSDEAIFAKF